ncbi:LysE family translocator [Ostreibacterium oceani]|uniref:LysE family translocator n=1 Tax=Ostreibacterium oceani TaxID=2654998 RepID=A0A6N7EY57_9GAMM|nr:LysE family translocator [Ostreibacterium oceani]MPV85408.1 LysE family translocator [Ostreibacterium oceani]
MQFSSFFNSLEISYPLSQWVALLIYVFTMVGTPGPNNIMLTSSGANFGYKRSIPHVLGIHAGCLSMILLMAFSFYNIFELYPASRQVMFVVGAMYLIWLAYRIATTPVQALHADDSKNLTQGKPLTLVQAALFQYVNPKAWVMITNVIIFYTLSGNAYLASIFVIVLTFFGFGFFINSAWVVFGSLIGRMLKTEIAWRSFNIAMALLLLACLPLML